MKKEAIVIILVILILPLILASVDTEIKKITNYAEEYEKGNINYVQLLVYISSAREGLNEELGATSKELGGIIKQDKLKEILGEPNEETKWVWVEGEEHDTKLDEAIPVWKKIIFDGKKIQIRMEAFPSIFKKNKFDEEGDFEQEIPKEGSLIYRLNFDVQFKRPEQKIDFQGKIDEIEELAKSGADMETLAKESVTAEMIFMHYFEQGGGKCEDIMKAVFGSENQRQIQQVLLQEIEFCEGDNFEGIMRLEMCDECEWNWINLDFHFEGRKGFKPPKEKTPNSMENYKNLDSSSFMSKTTALINEIQNNCQEEDYGRAIINSQELRMLTEAWNQEANNVWEQIEKQIEHPEGNEDPYYWIKQDQAQRQRAKDLRKQNYEERKEFYLGLFSGYEKKEYYFEQTDFEKRLIEEFREKGEEICDNNIDDNDNDQVDCDDSQCGGKICGKGTITAGKNKTQEMEVNYYCISGVCQEKEKINETKGPVCGNHICEDGEAVCSSGADCTNASECAAMDCKYYCPEDCVECPEHPPIECAGEVEFAGEDENGCPLPPICIKETEYCETDADCLQPTCGAAACVKEKEDQPGSCKIITLTKCGEGDCEDGEKQIKECGDAKKILVAICKENTWKETGEDCEGEPEENCKQHCWDYMSTITPECPGDLKISGIYPDCNCEWICDEISGEECITKEDCGEENDVCSNGKCETIPEKIDIEPTTKPSTEQPEIPIEEQTEEPEPSLEPESEESEPEEQTEEPEPTTEEQTEEPEPTTEEQTEELEPTTEEQPETPETTGEVIFGFFQTLLNRLRLTGATILQFQEEDNTESEPEPSLEPESEESEPEEQTEEPEPTTEEQPETPIKEPEGEYDEEYEEDYDDSEEWEKRESEERERHEQEQRERCREDCARPCIEECIRGNCGENIDCDIDEESKKCEKDCSADDSCIEKCMGGEEDWWKEFDEHKEEKGVFVVGGGCRKEQGRTNGFIWFGGWGEPYGELENLKHKYYEFGGEDWCQYELDNLIKQREEFEKGFNQEFAIWFFEDYLANSAEDWEQAVSGIFELYWKNIDNQMRIAHTMQCLGKNDINDLMEVNLINIEYETEYGRIEYWEEIQTIKMSEIDEKVTIISPYMKIWIFPSKEFMIYEMQNAMENHEFSGPPKEKLERKNQEGPTEEEKEKIRHDKRFMRDIAEVSEKYGGDLDLVIQFKDYETNQVVFNLYSQINERDIIKVEPMPPSENPAEDVRIELDFEIMYDIILTSEKEMRGAHIESPPWDRKLQPVQKVKEMFNGVKMYLKTRNLVSSAKYYPADAENDVKDIFKEFFVGMMGPKGPDKEEMMEEIPEEKENKLPESFDEGISGKAVWIS